MARRAQRLRNPPGSINNAGTTPNRQHRRTTCPAPHLPPPAPTGPTASTAPRQNDITAYTAGPIPGTTTTSPRQPEGGTRDNPRQQHPQHERRQPLADRPATIPRTPAERHRKGPARPPTTCPRNSTKNDPENGAKIASEVGHFVG